MMDEYDKCRFCKYWDNYEGSLNCYCFDKDGFKPNKQKIIEKAQETGLRISDVVALIEKEW